MEPIGDILCFCETRFPILSDDVYKHIEKLKSEKEMVLVEEEYEKL